MAKKQPKKQPISPLEYGSKIGSWSFIVGMLLAIVGGALSVEGLDATTTAMLMVLGLLVGFLNVTHRESESFLSAVLVLSVISWIATEMLEEIPGVGSAVASLMTAVMAFIIPAAVIVSLKVIYDLAIER